MKVNTDPGKPPGSEPPGSAPESLHQQGKLAPVSVFGLAAQVDFSLNSRKALKPHFFIASTRKFSSGTYVIVKAYYDSYKANNILHVNIQ